MLDYILKNHVFIDFGSEIHYGSDQAFVEYPIRFATVGFQLMDTNLLTEVADRIRITEGHKPMHPMDQYDEETCDQDGWYDFYYGVNEFLGQPQGDLCIEFVVVSENAEDNEEMYTVDLTPEERTYMYNRMDEQCRTYLGKGCKELLAEAREKMMEEENS